MRKKISLMIHLPTDAAPCQLEMMKQCKRLVDIVTQTNQLENEYWSIEFDVEHLPITTWQDAAKISPNFYWQNNYRMGVYCNGRSTLFKENLPALAVSGVSYINSVDKQPLKLGLNAVLVPSVKHFILPNENGERRITMMFSYALWQSTDQRAFIQCLKEVCQALNASYAYIDEGDWESSITWCPFLLFAENPQPDEVEEWLPGIYWLQIVNSSFFAKTGNVLEVAKHAPCDHIEILEHDGHSSLLLQMTDDIQKASWQKRLELRNYFKDSIHNIAFDNPLQRRWENIESYRHFPKKALRSRFLNNLKLVPFTEEEIDEFLDKIKQEE